MQQRKWIPHPGFATRQLYPVIAEHYASKLNQIATVTFYNEHVSKVPIIEVERRNGQNEIDYWRWMGSPHHIVQDRLPKQILGYYTKDRQISFVTGAIFYENEEASHIPTVEVNFGDHTDIWEWTPNEEEPAAAPATPAPTNGNGNGSVHVHRAFRWKLVDNLPVEGGTPVKYQVPPNRRHCCSYCGELISTKWELIYSVKPEAAEYADPVAQEEAPTAPATV